MSVACCTVHSHRAQAAGPAGKCRLGASAHESSCVSASCDTCQDFPLATPVRTSMHVVPATPCLPVPSAMTAYPARSERRHAHSSTCTRARARARSDAWHSRRQAARHCKRDERDQDEGEPRRRPIRRPVFIPMRHMARSRTLPSRRQYTRVRLCRATRSANFRVSADGCCCNAQLTAAARPIPQI
jgi:hypothetical protein